MQCFLLASSLQASHCPFKRCRAVEDLQEKPDCPPLPTLQQLERIANIPCKDTLFYFQVEFIGEMDRLVVERTTDLTVCYIRSPFRKQRRRKYSERKLVKQRWSLLSPELQRRQNDNMAIPEIQYAEFSKLSGDG